MIKQLSMNHPESTVSKTYRKAGSKIVEGMFRSLSRVSRLHPASQPERHGIERLNNISYSDSGRKAHLLDVYRPVHRKGPLPVCLYVHGGGFRILSKDTHWLMGLLFAHRGYLVFNINYRLAPQHPFPAAIQDTCDAFAWVLENAETYGGDPTRLVLAGESAGANLITALTVALCYKRPETYARRVWDLNTIPQAVAPACGLFQVSDIERFAKRRKLSKFVQDRLAEVSDAYLSQSSILSEKELELANPLQVFEKGQEPDRRLPAFFIPVGTGDVILDDTRRLHDALQTLGADSAARYYEKEAHAFHALIWRRNAKACWKATFEFFEDRIRDVQRSAA